MSLEFFKRSSSDRLIKLAYRRKGMGVLMSLQSLQLPHTFCLLGWIYSKRRIVL